MHRSMKKSIGNFILEGWKPTPVERALVDDTFKELLSESIMENDEKIPNDFLEVQDFNTAMEEIMNEINVSNNNK